MIRKRFYCFILLSFLALNSVQVHAQLHIRIQKIIEAVIPKKDSILYQVVRGQVLDQESKVSLPGATVWIQLDSVRILGTSANVFGDFKFDKVRVGRHTINASFVGYKQIQTSILTNAANETVLTIFLEELRSHLDPIEIKETPGLVNRSGGQVIKTDELNRLAGTRGEAIRKTSWIAGTQNADDSRNDVVIRGNSPGTVLWRLEGVNIPNPNHFNIPGTSGGPVTLINDKMLANSAFYSGAFPASYGNTNSGLFDLQFRSGNLKHASTAQLGVLGTEFASEGPLNKDKKSSYLFTTRIASLSMFYKIGIDIGIDAVPYYKDASFKLNFPTKKGSFSIFGLGGISNVDILVSKGHRNFYGEKDRDQYFRSATGLTGVTYQKSIDSLTYLTATLAVSSEQIRGYHEFVYPADVRSTILEFDNNTDADALPPILRYNFREKRILQSISFTKKLRHPGRVLNLGLNSDLYMFNFFDSARNINESTPESGTWRTRWNSQESSLLLQPFVQWKFASEKFDVIAGIHSQYFSLSNSYSLIEPRVIVKYYFNEHQSLNFGFGLHSQIQSPYLYFYGATNDSNGNPLTENKNMDFTRSRHIIIGYEHLFGEIIRVKTEIYHQALYNVPVERVSSSISLLNTGGTFTRLYPGALVNTGKGENYGLELTIDKPFSKGYLFLVTGSIFQSKYSGSDGIWRNTDFNGRYAVNGLFTRELTTKKQNIFSFGARVSSQGGRWYGPVDKLESQKQKIIVYEDATRNSLQLNSYFRADFRLSYKINRPKTSHEFTLDLINFLNTKNVLRLEYIPDQNVSSLSRIGKEYQLGRLPIFYYRLDF